MNANRNLRRIASATGLVAVLLGAAACGNEVVPVGDAPAPARIYPPTDVPELTYGPKPSAIPVDAVKERAQHQADRLGRAGGI
jgi:hypothetical protein